MKVNTYLIVTRYLSSRTSDRRPYVTLGCKRGGANKPRTEPRVDDEEEVHVKRRGPYGTKKCGCPFKLKENQQDVNDHESKDIEKFNAKSNPILGIVSNKISYLASKKIWLEISRAPKIIDDPKNKCGHYMRTSHSLPCSCELITRFDHMLPIQVVDIEALWKTLEIGSCHSSARQHDIDSEIRSVTGLLHHISIGHISKVREMRHLAKGVLSPVFPDDLGITLTLPPEVTVTKGRKKANSMKIDNSYWEHVSIAHRKTQKSSGSGLGTGSRSGSSSGSGSGSRVRGRPPRGPRGRE
ncbi:hypothetical protein M9H77_25652 [Catharanthus roseus]|uniref:Uncharacterized protein n=1 Tax=Catharanthus roseus TaxID=4058 RepID=A0ACC0A7R4_CATRO|nr:hypothetical protein M9H77_25652 [Catharanthus roseus]